MRADNGNHFNAANIINVIILSSIIIKLISVDIRGDEINYREEMRKFVARLSEKGKREKPEFIVIPQNALDILTVDGSYSGKPVIDYLSVIDGIGCEELYYGINGDGRITPAGITEFMLPFLKLFHKNNKPVLIIDYIKNADQAEQSYVKSKKLGFISFQAERSLSLIPDKIYDANKNSIKNLQNAKNFLYIINGSKFRSLNQFLFMLNKTEYDLLIIDPFFKGKILTRNQVASLKTKPHGERRLVISYLSIGEAEDYRYYWKKEWKTDPPSFLEKENPEWRGNFKVKYWLNQWKEIVYDSNDSYLNKIINAGFDGVYLDIIDAAHYFEKK